MVLHKDNDCLCSFCGSGCKLILKPGHRRNMNNQYQKEMVEMMIVAMITKR